MRNRPTPSAPCCSTRQVGDESAVAVRQCGAVARIGGQRAQRVECRGDSNRSRARSSRRRDGVGRQEHSALDAVRPPRDLRAGSTRSARQPVTAGISSVRAKIAPCEVGPAVIRNTAERGRDPGAERARAQVVGTTIEPRSRVGRTWRSPHCSITRRRCPRRPSCGRGSRGPGSCPNVCDRRQHLGESLRALPVSVRACAAAPNPLSSRIWMWVWTHAGNRAKRSPSSSRCRRGRGARK